MTKSVNVEVSECVLCIGVSETVTVREYRSVSECDRERGRVKVKESVSVRERFKSRRQMNMIVDECSSDGVSVTDTAATKEVPVRARNIPKCPFSLGRK